MGIEGRVRPEADSGSAPQRGHVAAVVGLVVVLALAAAALLADRPPPAVPASAPTADFSAERAWAHLERIATEPSPIGTESNREVRSHLVGQLERLGIEVEVSEGLGAWTFGSHSEVGQVSNVIGRLPGTNPTGRVILAAHYDTVVHSPGASDDKGPVAALLEVARALTTGPPLRNDVVFLLTDGEEPGLLGAASFAAEHEEVAAGGVVLNWEGYGNTGPSVLYQTSPGNVGVVDAFARWVPRPVGDSAVAALFELGSNNTDFVVLQESGFVGLDISWVDGVAHYHASTDTIANLDPSSLQHHGESMLGLARGLGEHDLTTVESGHDVIYFSVFGQVVSYPESWAWHLALVGLAAVLGVAGLARVLRLATVPRMVAATGLMIVPVVGVPAAAVGMWQVLVSIRPHYASLVLGDIGDTYRPGAFKAALVVLSLALVLGWFILWRRRIGGIALAVGALAVVAGAGLAAAAGMPGLSYVGSLSALAASLGMLGGLVLWARHPTWATMSIAAGIAPGVVLTSSVVRSALAAMGIAGGYGAAVFVVFTAQVAIPLIARLSEGSALRHRALGLRWIPLVGVGLAALLAGIGLGVDRFDEDHPERAHLVYLHDAETQTSLWTSEDSDPHPWIAHLLPTQVGDNPVGFPLPYRTRVRWIGPAAPAELSAPELTVLEHTPASSGSEIRLHVRSARDADVVVVNVGALAREVTVEVAGEVVIVPEPRFDEGEEGGEWPYELRFSNPPPEGFELALRTGGPDLPDLAVSDITFGLGELEGFVPRPTGLAPRSHTGIESDSVVVGWRY